MKQRILLSVFLIVSLLVSSHGYGTPQMNCPYADQELTRKQIDKILDEHKAWFLNNHCKTYFNQMVCDNELETSPVNLCQANLTGVNLSDANLSGVVLIGAKLINARLNKANMIGAVLRGADLNGAVLIGANLTGANLKSANFLNANLSGAVLRGANLTGAFWVGANLTGAQLREITVSGDIDFFFKTYSQVDMIRSTLVGANLGHANLTGVDLYKFNLTDANLIGVDLTGTLMEYTNLTGVFYEPKLDTLPIISRIAQAKGLSSLRYKGNKQGLLQLRKAFYDAGYREQAKEITYAIKHTETIKLLDGSLINKIDGIFGLVFFEWTTEWGMSPSNALLTLLSLILFFFFFYLFALQKPTEHNGIWRYRSHDRPVYLDKPEKHLVSFNGFWRSVPLALYFSILSSFHFGWRDINLGNWIVRLQFNEYTFRPTGWVRTVAGIQSLISVYLVAIWVLTYFGRPFDW